MLFKKNFLHLNTSVNSKDIFHLNKIQGNLYVILHHKRDVLDVSAVPKNIYKRNGPTNI